MITPDAQLLSSISLPDTFELGSLDAPMVTAVGDLADAVGALGGEKWFTTTVMGSDPLARHDRRLDVERGDGGRTFPSGR